MEVAPRYTLLTLFILLKLLYTAQTVGCMPIYVVTLCEVRMLLESTDELLSKKWSGVDGYSLDCCDY